MCLSECCFSRFSFRNSSAKSTAEPGTGLDTPASRSSYSPPLRPWEPKAELSVLLRQPPEGFQSRAGVWQAGAERDQPLQKHWWGSSGSFSAVPPDIWVLSTLLTNAVTAIQGCKGRQESVTADRQKRKKIAFLSFLMHWSVWLLQGTLSPFTMSHWQQHPTNSTAREILWFVLQRNFCISQQCHWLIN